jgi:glycosyltransferase involved in cell wall biosynthesis
MSDTRLTFAIPFYGSPAFLQRAIASVCAQTTGDWRAVVVDDCGPGADAREVVETFGDARVRYCRNDQNLGLAGNWNRCLELSTTTLVTLLHSDDELLPHYAETMLDAHANCPNAAAIFCATEVIDSESKPIFSLRDHVKRWMVPAGDQFVLAGQDGVCGLVRGNFVMCPTLCYNVDRLQGMRFSTRLRFVVDLEFYLRALMAGAVLVGLSDIAYRYRRHADQATARSERDLSMFTEEIELWRWAAGESRSRGWLRAATIAEKMRIIKLQIVVYALADLLRAQPRRAVEKLALLRKTARPLSHVT